MDDSSSDEEVFFGPISDKEQKVINKHNVRNLEKTVLFDLYPGLNNEDKEFSLELSAQNISTSASVVENELDEIHHVTVPLDYECLERKSISNEMVTVNNIEGEKVNSVSELQMCNNNEDLDCSQKEESELKYSILEDDDYNRDFDESNLTACSTRVCFDQSSSMKDDLSSFVTNEETLYQDQEICKNDKSDILSESFGIEKNNSGSVIDAETGEFVATECKDISDPVFSNNIENDCVQMGDIKDLQDALEDINTSDAEQQEVRNIERAKSEGDQIELNEMQDIDVKPNGFSGLEIKSTNIQYIETGHEVEDVEPKQIEGLDVKSVCKEEQLIEAEVQHIELNDIQDVEMKSKDVSGVESNPTKIQYIECEQNIEDILSKQTEFQELKDVQTETENVMDIEMQQLDVENIVDAEAIHLKAEKDFEKIRSVDFCAENDSSEIKLKETSAIKNEMMNFNMKLQEVSNYEDQVEDTQDVVHSEFMHELEDAQLLSPEKQNQKINSILDDSKNELEISNLEIEQPEIKSHDIYVQKVTERDLTTEELIPSDLDIEEKLKVCNPKAGQLKISVPDIGKSENHKYQSISTSSIELPEDHNSKVMHNSSIFQTQESAYNCETVQEVYNSMIELNVSDLVMESKVSISTIESDYSDMMEPKVNDYVIGSKVYDSVLEPKVVDSVFESKYDDSALEPEKDFTMETGIHDVKEVTFDNYVTEVKQEVLDVAIKPKDDDAEVKLEVCKSDVNSNAEDFHMKPNIKDFYVKPNADDSDVKLEVHDAEVKLERSLEIKSDSDDNEMNLKEPLETKLPEMQDIEVQLLGSREMMVQSNIEQMDTVKSHRTSKMFNNSHVEGDQLEVQNETKLPRSDDEANVSELENYLDSNFEHLEYSKIESLLVLDPKREEIPKIELETANQLIEFRETEVAEEGKVAAFGDKLHEHQHSEIGVLEITDKISEEMCTLVSELNVHFETAIQHAEQSELQAFNVQDIRHEVKNVQDHKECDQEFNTLIEKLDREIDMAHFTINEVNSVLHFKEQLGNENTLSTKSTSEELKSLDCSMPQINLAKCEKLGKENNKENFLLDEMSIISDIGMNDTKFVKNDKFESFQNQIKEELINASDRDTLVQKVELIKYSESDFLAEENHGTENAEIDDFHLMEKLLCNYKKNAAKPTYPFTNADLVLQTSDLIPAENIVPMPTNITRNSDDFNCISNEDCLEGQHPDASPLVNFESAEVSQDHLELPPFVTARSSTTKKRSVKKISPEDLQVDSCEAGSLNTSIVKKLFEDAKSDSILTDSFMDTHDMENFLSPSKAASSQVKQLILQEKNNFPSNVEIVPSPKLQPKKQSKKATPTKRNLKLPDSMQKSDVKTQVKSQLPQQHKVFLSKSAEPSKNRSKLPVSASISKIPSFGPNMISKSCSKALSTPAVLAAKPACRELFRNKTPAKNENIVKREYAFRLPKATAAVSELPKKVKTPNKYLNIKSPVGKYIQQVTMSPLLQTVKPQSKIASFPGPMKPKVENTTTEENKEYPLLFPAKYCIKPQIKESAKPVLKAHNSPVIMKHIGPKRVIEDADYLKNEESVLDPRFSEAFSTDLDSTLIQHVNVIEYNTIGTLNKKGANLAQTKRI